MIPSEAQKGNRHRVAHQQDRKRAQKPILQLDAINGILSATDETTLSQAARFCRKHGFIFPLARPLPPLLTGQAVRDLLPFSDAFVVGISGDTPDGSFMETVVAPRAAIGPDLMGAVLAPLGGCVLKEIRIRVFSQALVQEIWLQTHSTDEVVFQLQAEMRRGIAFAVEVQGRQMRLVQGEAVRRASGEADPSRKRQKAHLSFPRHKYRSGRLINWADSALLKTQVEKGNRILGAPFAGRLGTISIAPAIQAKENWHVGISKLRDALMSNATKRLK